MPNQDSNEGGKMANGGRNIQKALGICVAATLAVSIMVVASSPASARGPKPVELVLEPSGWVGPDGADCGVKLTASYTGGRGNYQFTYTLRWGVLGEPLGSGDTTTTRFARKDSPDTLVPLRLIVANKNVLAFSGQLTDRKGNVAASFPLTMYEFENCDLPQR